MAMEHIQAEELAKEFKEHSVAEFFKKNKQMLGLYGKIRTMTTIVHEYVTNSLDACEESNILPNIEVQIKELGNEYYEIIVTDNGPGLTEKTVGKAFGQLLAGTKFHRMIQMRGQQGIGASGGTMLSQMTTGKAVKVLTGTEKGKAISLEITIDPKKNVPKITNMQTVERKFQGTKVQAKFKDVIYRDSSTGPLEYLRRTAIANPHARIKFKGPKGQKALFKRTIKIIPKKAKEMKPHPHGVTVDELISMSKYTDAKKVASFLKNDFDRTGSTSIEKIEKKVKFDLNKDPKQLSWQESEEIIKAFKKIDFIAPNTDGLSPIGENRIKKSLNAIVAPEFVHTITRKPKVYAGGFPFQIEVGIAYGGNAGKKADGEGRSLEIMRFANRAPLLFDAGSGAISKAVQSVEWKRYGVRDLDSIPLTVFVNFISAHVPYMGAGKQAIADEDEIMEELRLSLMDCGRKTATYIKRKLREKERLMQQDMFYKYIPEIARALKNITGEKEEFLTTKLEKLVKEKLGLEKLQENLKQEETEPLENEVIEEVETSGEKEDKEKNTKENK